MNNYSFDSLVGNTNVLNVLRRELSEDTLNNFIIFEGDPGTGKSTCAEIIALYKGCDNPINGNPCLQCPRCKANLKTLENGTIGQTFIKYNMASGDVKQTLNQVITQVFRNAAPVHQMVYIFEEFHALTKAEQSSLLEEFRTLDDNVFIIATTTKYRDIIPEMQSRANKYTFKRLTKAEMKLLLHNLTRSMGVTKYTQEVENMMIEYSKGIPRNLIKIFEHAIKANMTTDELATFCGSIPNSVMLNFLEILVTGTIEEVSTHTNYLLEEYRYSDLLEHLFEFMVNITYYLSGRAPGTFSTHDISRINSFMTLSKAIKIDSLLENYKDLGEAQFKLHLIKINVVMNQRNKKPEADKVMQQTRVATSNRKEVKRMDMANKRPVKVSEQELQDYINSR